MKLSALLRSIPKTTLVALSLTALSGCDKVNRENYDKLKMGMEYKEVITLLGEPQSCQSILTAKSCVWGKPPKTIDIKLIAGKVVLFSNEGL
ncbi:MAG: hypothetical protein ABFS02_09315 [Pseudomonadota bacterium]